MSRNLVTVVWKITVDSSSSSVMCAPGRMAGPVEFGLPLLPGSTNWTDDTAKALLGTTRAVTVPGMSLAYSGLRSIWT